MERMVITGIGVIAPNGLSKEEYWGTLAESENSFEGVRHGGEIKDFDIEKICGGKDTRRTDRFTNLGLAALEQAVQDAGLSAGTYDEQRVGSILSTTYGSSRTVGNYLGTIINQGMQYASPMLFPNTVINAAIGKLSIDFRLKGISSVICGANPVCYAFGKLKEGKGDVIFAGGVDTIDPVVAKAYHRLRLLDGGFVLSEGAGFVVLETLSGAVRRNARIYAEVLGTGVVTDDELNMDITKIKCDSIRRTMGLALQSGGIEAGQVDVIQSLANGEDTAREERKAIADVFGPKAGIMQVTMGKTVYGEAFSAAEMFGVINAVLAMAHDGGKFRYALSNSLNIGGNVTTVLLKKYEG